MEAYDATQTPSRLERGTPPPIVPSYAIPPRRLRCLDLGAYGASVVRPPTQILFYAYDTTGSQLTV